MTIDGIEIEAKRQTNELTYGYNLSNNSNSETRLIITVRSGLRAIANTFHEPLVTLPFHVAQQRIQRVYLR